MVGEGDGAFAGVWERFVSGHAFRVAP